ncbi:NADH dehydrogenase [ubiquinone] 1 alpha subcomplex subunit 1 [Pogona vitticeps]|uniref:NADH dehydrogenase [ubiquinone] 1 alpha subcomplex subunit 1 n=1 Tax=Pogona vitticeps TaxID=103695 RepID=A0ABM5EW55_9SAUR
MWYEILPSLGVIYAFLVMPGIALTYIQKKSSGDKPKRIVRTPNSFFMMERDVRVSKTNRYYDSKGLENID